MIMQDKADRPIRRSPINFDARPAQTRRHNGFEVALRYENDPDELGAAPAVIDLSHMAKWDIQDSDLSRINLSGRPIPEKPGECDVHEGGTYVFRLNATQAGVWHICPDESLPVAETIFADPAFTETTDGRALLAIVGPSVPSFIEKITDLDLSSPHRKPPFVMQGPILHVASRVLVLRFGRENSTVFFSFPRGYGQAVADALLDSGSRQGVRFAGEHLLKTNG